MRILFLSREEQEENTKLNKKHTEKTISKHSKENIQNNVFLSETHFIQKKLKFIRCQIHDKKWKENRNSRTTSRAFLIREHHATENIFIKASTCKLSVNYFQKKHVSLKSYTFI